MNESTVLFAAASRTADLANSAMPNAPVVEFSRNARLTVWLSMRSSTSHMLRWLADLTEPSIIECGGGTPVNAARA